MRRQPPCPNRPASCSSAAHWLAWEFGTARRKRNRQHADVFAGVAAHVSIQAASVGEEGSGALLIRQVTCRRRKFINYKLAGSAISGRAPARRLRQAPPAWSPACGRAAPCRNWCTERAARAAHSAARRDRRRDVLRRLDLVGRDVDRADQHVLAVEQRRSARSARANWRIRARPGRSGSPPAAETSARIGATRAPSVFFQSMLALMP